MVGILISQVFMKCRVSSLESIRFLCNSSQLLELLSPSFRLLKLMIDINKLDDVSLNEIKIKILE
ncbi:hypothetical protein V1477_021223 [Vespula maculifrons]|uniref:Uncharacterized protein n=1 Tax=Vespula maculifrons TaxID=7453 RepID=A0ABD2AGK1_VESMC